MVANLLSFLISRRFQPVPVYHALLQQDHVHLPSAATRVAPASWTAADVMGDHAQLGLGQAEHGLGQHRAHAVRILGTGHEGVGVVGRIVVAEHLRARLERGDKLRIKLGLDPTAPLPRRGQTHPDARAELLAMEMELIRKLASRSEVAAAPVRTREKDKIIRALRRLK